MCKSKETNWRQLLLFKLSWREYVCVPEVCVCVCVFLVPGTASEPSGALPSSPPVRCRVDPSVHSSLSARPSTPTPPQSWAQIGGSLHCSDWWTRPVTCGHPSPLGAPDETNHRGKYLKHHLHVGQKVIYNDYNKVPTEKSAAGLWWGGWDMLDVCY